MHHQDKLLIIEALVAYGGDARTLRPRERRAWELAEKMLDGEGLPADVLVSDVDEE
jgi:Cdc6-like AAA superfamily ATPase